MIIYHADCLHKCVTNSAPNKFESPLNQIFTHGIRLRGIGGNISHPFPCILDRPSIHELPDVIVKTAEFLLYLQKCSGVGDSRTNFKSISYNLRIGE